MANIPNGTVVGNLGPPVAPQQPPTPYSQTAATAARVAAALAKSAQGAAPQPTRHQQFYGHNPNLKCMFIYYSLA